MPDFGKALGERLRAVRRNKELSLAEVEKLSGGRWKAVVVGSYERNDRAVTMAKLSELADFYGVPVTVLLPPPEEFAAAGEPKIVFDRRLLEQLPAEYSPVARYAVSVQRRRGDFTGALLSIRQEDLQMLSVLCGVPRSELVEVLVRTGVLLPTAQTIEAQVLDLRDERVVDLAAGDRSPTPGGVEQPGLRRAG